MNHALTAMAIIVITVVAVAYVQRQSVLGVTRNFDNTGPVVHGWTSPWSEGLYRGRGIRCAINSDPYYSYSIALATSAPWGFEAKQKGFASVFKKDWPLARH